MINVNAIRSKCEDPTQWESFRPCEYEDIIERFEYEIMTYVEIGLYQGDSLILFKDNDRYGFLSFGWGSCSVCDALKGCNNAYEIIELAINLHDSIQWYSKNEMIEYLSNKDWESEWYCDNGGAKEFGDKAVAILRNI